MGLVLEELHIGVEKVSLGDMDALHAELVNELEDAGDDGGLTDGGYVGVGSKKRLVFENDAVELRDVELVGSGTRRDVKGEAVAGEYGVGNLEDQGLDV